MNSDEHPILDPGAMADFVGPRQELSNNQTDAINRLRGDQLEAVLGETTDFLPYGFLEEGTWAGRAVGRVVVRKKTSKGPQVLGFGTGFLIAPSILMTNAHVLPNVEYCKVSQVQFAYETDVLGNEKDSTTFALDPGALFVSSPKEALDFTLVRVKPDAEGAPGERWGSISLSDNPAKVAMGDHVNIIGHPDGRRKEVVLRDNRVTGFFEGGFVRYVADTLKGSSGSPVFNCQWELCLLHHTGVYQRDENGKVVIVNGEPQYSANEGIRISAIIRHLMSDAVPEDIRNQLAEHINFTRHDAVPVDLI